MKKILSLIIPLILLNHLLGEDVPFWEHSIIDTERISRGEVSGLDIMVPYQYSISTDYLRGISKPNFETGENFVPIAKALEISFNEYFGAYGITKEEFYQMVEITLEKVDDYTLSRTSKKFRTFPRAWRDFWFYSIKCDWFFGKDNLNAAPPVLVLMDGSILRGYLKPKIEKKKKERKEFEVSHKKHSQRTLKKLMWNNLAQVAVVADQYFLQNPDAIEFKFVDYFDFMPFDLPITIWDGEDYDSIVVDRDWKEIKIESKSGVVSTFKKQ